jgi:hypothetical protein
MQVDMTLFRHFYTNATIIKTASKLYKMAISQRVIAESSSKETHYSGYYYKGKGLCWAGFASLILAVSFAPAQCFFISLSLFICSLILLYAGEIALANRRGKERHQATEKTILDFLRDNIINGGKKNSKNSENNKQNN